MPNKAFVLAETAMPGWKAVSSAGQMDRPRPVEADSQGIDIVKLRAKYFGAMARTAVADAAEQVSDGQIVKVESTKTQSGGPKQLRVLVSNGKVTGIQG